MKLVLHIVAIILVIWIFLFISCQKEISCEGCKDGNKPPIAITGPDLIITLPTDSVLLDGNNSSDPDGTITKWLWTKISGPASFNIVNANNVQTQVTSLIEGVYQFKLKVTDDKGASSFDTMNVTVNRGPPLQVCGDTTRQKIFAQLIPIGSLSQFHPNLSAISSGNKIFFAGGTILNRPSSKRVDILDLNTNTWSIADLSVARGGIATVALGSKVYFAGGTDDINDNFFNVIDVYDLLTNSWSISTLNNGLYGPIAAAVIDNKIFFAGGYDVTATSSNKVEIFDPVNNSWSESFLSEARSYINAVTLNNKIYFAGGAKDYQVPTNRIDIYDNNTNTWSTSSLLSHTGHVSSVAVNEKIYWGGGCPVEIRNVNSGNSSIPNLSKPGGGFSVIKDGKIVFISSGDKFDIYDVASNTWSIGVLPQPITPISVISVNNTIYVVGYMDSGLPNQVWKLEF